MSGVDLGGSTAYLDDPGHQRVATEVLAPMTATRIAVQFEVPPAFVGA